MISFKHFFDKFLIESEVRKSNRDFSAYEFKLANRKAEFERLSHVYSQLGSTIKILSFPNRYAFEEEMLKNLPNKNIQVWSAEVPNEKNKVEFIVKQGLEFIRKHPGKAEVFVPVKNPGDRFKTVILSKLLDDEHDDMWGKLSKAIVDGDDIMYEGKFYDLPKNFNVIDMDYTGAPAAQKITEVCNLWNNRLVSGGVLLVTFGTSEQFGNTDMKIQSSFKGLRKMFSTPDEIKRYPDELLKRVIDRFKTNLYTTPSGEVFTGNNKEKFGLNNIEVFETTDKPAINNVINSFKNYIKVNPTFANLYRGGTSSKGTIVMRLAYVKP